MLYCLPTFAYTIPDNMDSDMKKWDGIYIATPKRNGTVGNTYDVCLGSTSSRANGSGVLPRCEDGITITGFNPNEYIYWNGKQYTSADRDGYVRIAYSPGVDSYRKLIDQPQKYTGIRSGKSVTLTPRIHKEKDHRCVYCGAWLGAYTSPVYYYNDQSAQLKKILDFYGVNPGDYFHIGRNTYYFVNSLGAGRIKQDTLEEHWGSMYAPSAYKCGVKYMPNNVGRWDGDYWDANVDTFNRVGPVPDSDRYTAWYDKYPVIKYPYFPQDGQTLYRRMTHGGDVTWSSEIIVEHWYRNWSHDSSEARWWKSITYYLPLFTKDLRTLTNVLPRYLYVVTATSSNGNLYTGV